MGVDPGATSATLEVEGNRVAIPRDGPAPRPIPMQWPSRGGITLTFDPEAFAGPIAFDGAWSSMKLVARGRLLATRAQDRLRLTLQQGERSVEFELRASSIVHPFALAELREFRCPALAP